MKPGEVTTIQVNQGVRDAVVLAIIGTKALVEYTMPKGSTALQIIDMLTDEPTPGRSVSYFALPTKWLRAIVKAGMDWDGNPQQTGTRRPGTPAAMLAERRQRKGHDEDQPERTDGQEDAGGDPGGHD